MIEYRWCYESLAAFTELSLRRGSLLLLTHVAKDRSLPLVGRHPKLLRKP